MELASRLPNSCARRSIRPKCASYGDLPPREPVQRPSMSIMATGVRRDGLRIGNRQKATPISDLPYRSSPSPLRQWSRKTHFLRFPPHAHAAHNPVKGPKRRGIATGSPRGVRDASWNDCVFLRGKRTLSVSARKRIRRRPPDAGLMPLPLGCSFTFSRAIPEGRAHG